MDFEFSPEQQTFIEQVEAFLDANDDPDVFDVTRRTWPRSSIRPSGEPSWPSSARWAGWG